jgi:hypothetical protein
MRRGQPAACLNFVQSSPKPQAAEVAQTEAGAENSVAVRSPRVARILQT